MASFRRFFAAIILAAAAALTACGGEPGDEPFETDESALSAAWTPNRIVLTAADVASLAEISLTAGGVRTGPMFATCSETRCGCYGETSCKDMIETLCQDNKAECSVSSSNRLECYCARRQTQVAQNVE